MAAKQPPKNIKVLAILRLQKDGMPVILKKGTDRKSAPLSLSYLLFKYLVASFHLGISCQTIETPAIITRTLNVLLGVT